MAGRFVRLTRNPEGLAAILRHFFALPFHIEEWRPQRLWLDDDDCTALGIESVGSRLGQGAICGVSVLDRQHRFRIHVGPLSFAEYQAFLPKRKQLLQLRDWVRNYLGHEFAWDVRLVLKHDEVPRLRLGSPAHMLGWSTWMGRSPAGVDRGDLAFECEPRDKSAKRRSPSRRRQR